ncbi:MAG: DNA replication/repair protein RecF [Ruminococcaceae bacterium]|nr:DNA replication/repair protein RecF [Oscillospiraceae bacterium]
MQCNRIEVTNFRNIEHAEVEFDSGVNVLVGDNAQGKTNLLEAIYLCALGKTFRAAKDAELVRFGQEECSIVQHFEDSAREQVIEMQLGTKSRRRVLHNGVNLARTSQLLGNFRVVLFCPEHLSLVKEGPGERRNFLDVAISQLHPAYIRSLQRYNQLLKQRNSLLKLAETDRRTFDDTVELWSTQLAHEAAYLSSVRYEYVKALNAHVGEFFAGMSGERESVCVRYMGKAHVDEDMYADREYCERAYLRLYMSHHDREIAAGSTLWGIHRDDLEIELNGKYARIFASQGQQRSIALAMKMAEGEISCAHSGHEYPVFLFDDVLSELDAGRRTFLLGEITDRQVIMTSCEIDRTSAKNTILVNAGTYQRKEI